MRKVLCYAAAGIICGFLIKLFVLDVPTVSGSSMEPALHDRQHIIVNKLAYGIVRPFSATRLTTWASPKAGDIIIYMYDGEAVVKRCAATSCTPLDYSCDTQYTLTVGGQRIPLTYEQYRLLCGMDHVPEGTVLAIGDNYESSVDSRSYGFIPESDILGKVLWN